MRARRLSKEMMAYWKRFEKVEKEHRRRAEKEAQEQRKMDGELREVRDLFQFVHMMHFVHVMLTLGCRCSRQYSHLLNVFSSSSIFMLCIIKV